MGGGLMQLVAYGSQDIYLTGNPQFTFFKVVYKRHTNFSIESIEQSFSGSADYGKKFSVTIARNGDLLTKLWIEMDVDCSGGSPSVNAGFQLIDYIEIEIGGQVIDKQYGEWMAIWCDLTHTTDQQFLLQNMLGDEIDMVNSGGKADIFIPLQFWFCRNTGLALPLIALQYHEVKLNIQMKPAAPTKTGIYGIDEVRIYADYIFLDTDERRRFAQVSHEYLIEQVQFSNDLLSVYGGNQHDLRFNHPVKELIWVVEKNDDFGGGDLDVIHQNPISSAVIQLNGQDRFKRRKGTYFSKVQRYQHHTGIGNLEYVYIYSFGLKPEEHQPSGTCNFSRIDNAIISYTQESQVADVFRMWAVNYNVLRIMSGMAGLAYSN